MKWTPQEVKRELRKLAREEAKKNDHLYQPCPNNYDWEDWDDWMWGMTWEDFK